jgi:hypothetical protein
MTTGDDIDKAAARRQIAMTQLRLQDPDLGGERALRSLLEKAEDDFHAAWSREERAETAGNAKTWESNAPAFLDYPGG